MTALFRASSEPSSHASPTASPVHPSGLASVLERNIEALKVRRAREQADASLPDRIALAITRFTGSMTFVYVHLVLVGAWVAINLGLVPGAPRFDKTFVILATWASVEAIFLSTFVLISQNRSSEAADRRAELDLQIGLLSEHEVTKLLTLVRAIADKLQIQEASNPEIEELQRDVAPEAVLDELEAGAARAG